MEVVWSDWKGRGGEGRGEGTYGAPEFGVVAFGYDGAGAVGAEGRADEVEGADELLGVRGVDAVFGRFAHGYDEDVVGVPVEGEVGLVDVGGGHFCFCCRVGWV